jgi:tRNA(Ile)-lysidine synthase
LSGLAAMKSKEGKVIRPLLSISREEILEYAKNKKLAWMEDITNFDLSFNRNYIRHKVLPTFFDINTEYLNNIYRTTRIISEVDEHLKQEAKKYADADVSELQKLEKPVLYEVFALKYEEVKGDRKDLTYRNIDDLTNLISKTAGCKSVDLPADVVAKRNYQKLEIKRKKEDNGYSIVSKSKLKIGKNYFNDWIFDIAITNNFVPSALKDTLFIDSDRLPDLHIRPPKAGDKIKKEGITGRTKLQDIFTNAKISKDKRTNWPIIVNQNDEILWIPKVTYSRESYPKTKKIIKITLQEGSK